MCVRVTRLIFYRVTLRVCDSGLKQYDMKSKVLRDGKKIATESESAESAAAKIQELLASVPAAAASPEKI